RPEYERLIDEVCDFLPCVIDRVCSDSKVVGNKIVVPVENYGKLSLGPGADTSFFLGRLSQHGRAKKIISIEPVFELAVMKKKWLLNGPHILLALNAIFDGRLAF